MKHHLTSFLLVACSFSVGRCFQSSKGKVALFQQSNSFYKRSLHAFIEPTAVPKEQLQQKQRPCTHTLLYASQKFDGEKNEYYFNTRLNEDKCNKPYNNEKRTQSNHHPFDEFLAKEKQRFDKIIQFEKQRLQKINKFLDSERDRYSQLEKQEKKSLSTFVDDGVVGQWANALMRVDSSSDLYSRTSRKPTSQAGWTKLILDPIRKNAPSTPSSNKRKGSTTVTKNNKNNSNSSVSNNNSKELEEEFVFLYEPPSRDPSIVIMFLGGAGLGQFPHITYSELLSRVSTRLNAAIITAPYHIGLDHYELSKDTGVLLHRALEQCQQSGRYSSTIPKFFLGHSLGSKLFTISTAAMNDILGNDLSGVGLISFNNFGFIETTKQVRTFTENIKVPDKFNYKHTTKMIDSILEFAEQALTMTGLEFSPSPKQTTDRIINEKYDELLTSKTRLFVFDDDDLDSSYDFYKAVQSPELISISGLPGNHLSPNFIKFDLDYIDIPLEAQSLGIDRSSTNIQSISYGDERNLALLVDEVVSWILGQDPTRGPHWQKKGMKNKEKKRNANIAEDSLLILC